MMTQRELELEQKLVEQQRNQQIRAIDLIASWNPYQPEGEIGVAIAQWAMEGDTRSLWKIFEAALEDLNYHSLIPTLKQVWEQWEIDSEAKWKQWEVGIEAAHDRFLDQQERDVF